MASRALLQRHADSIDFWKGILLPVISANQKIKNSKQQKVSGKLIPSKIDHKTSIFLFLQISTHI